MIRFKRRNNKVVALINDGISDTDWYFEHSLKHKSEAEICRRHFRDLLDKRVKRIREKAYNKGYKDGRNHRKKLKYFHYNLDTDIPTGY